MAATTTQKQPTLGDYGEAVSPFDYPLTAEDIKRMQGEAQAEYGMQAATAGGIGAGQLALSLIDTQADIANKEELAKLQSRAKKGELGLTGGERQRMERAYMDPVRALAGESQKAEEASIAASGRGSSAADVVRARREGRRRLDEASIGVSQRIEQAHAEEAQREAQELSERLATEANRERQRIEMVGQTIAGLATNLGKVAAAGAKKTSMTDGQIIAMIGETDKAGNPRYPGLKGKSLAEARALIEAGDVSAIFGTPGPLSQVEPASAGRAAAPLADRAAGPLAGSITRASGDR